MTEKQVRKLVNKSISKKLNGYDEDSLTDMVLKSINFNQNSNSLISFMKEDEINTMEINAKLALLLNL